MYDIQNFPPFFIPSSLLISWNCPGIGVGGGPWIDIRSTPPRSGSHWPWAATSQTHILLPATHLSSHPPANQRPGPSLPIRHPSSSTTASSKSHLPVSGQSSAQEARTASAGRGTGAISRKQEVPFLEHRPSER